MQELKWYKTSHFYCDKATGASDIITVLLSSFIMKGNTKFHFEFDENKDVFFFPIQVHGPFELYSGTPILRTSCLDLKRLKKFNNQMQYLVI